VPRRHSIFFKAMSRSDNRVAVANDRKVRQRAFDLSRRPTFELLGAVGFDSAVITARTCEDRSFAGLDVTRMYALLPCCVVNVYKLRFRSAVTFSGPARRNLFCNGISVWARNMRDGIQQTRAPLTFPRTPLCPSLNRTSPCPTILRPPFRATPRSRSRTSCGIDSRNDTFPDPRRRHHCRRLPATVADSIDDEGGTLIDEIHYLTTSKPVNRDRHTLR
jgi:hypothetical protein